MQNRICNFWIMWQWRKLRQLTDWKKSRDSKKPGTLRTKPETPNHQDIVSTAKTHLLSLDLLPRGTYWKTFSVSSPYFPIFLKKKICLHFFFLNSEIQALSTHFFFRWMMLVLFISPTSTPFNMITSQFLINCTSVLLLLCLCKYLSLFSEVM